VVCAPAGPTRGGEGTNRSGSDRLDLVEVGLQCLADEIAATVPLMNYPG
jgi:hypothetical protein